MVYDTDAVGTANAAIRNESFAHILETYLPQDVLFGLTVKQFKEGNDQRGFEYLGALLEHNQMYGKGQSETKSRNFKILEAIKDVLYTRDGLATKKSLVAKNRHFLELFFGQLTAISPPFIGSRIYVELTTQYSDEIPYHHPKLGKKLQIEFSKQALRFWKQELGQLSTFLKKNISQLSRIKSSDRLYQVVLENIGDDRSLLDSFFIRKVFYEGQLFINADDFDLSDLKSLPNVISSVFLPKINQLGRMLRDGRTLSGAVHQKLMKTFIIMDYFDPAEFSKL